MYQSLFIFVVVILIIWWALRRNVAASDKDAPTSHGNVEHVVEPHAEHEAPKDPVEDEKLAEPVSHEPAPAPAPVPEPEVQVVLESAPAAEPPAVPAEVAKPDNLVIIEGIGPRIAGILKNAGVTTFAQMADMQPEQIKEMLTTVDERLGRIADPTTWPKQAALAAKGEMEALQTLQDSLRGGRD